MIETLKTILIKYRHLYMYIIFGILTTVVNFAFYYFGYNIVGLANILATILAWGVAVIFAFITNKLWVFDSKSVDKTTLMHEIPSFFGTRIATGILDVGIMYVAADLLAGNAALWKLISNVIVIILNYASSRLIIFTRWKKQ